MACVITGGQFPGLRERLIVYGQFISEKLEQMGAEVFRYDLVDCEQEGKRAGEYFNRQNVDLIFLHSATYVTSASVLPVHQLCKTPVVILNLQPAARIDYEKTITGEWLAHCGACTVPEITNAFRRSGIECYVISGLLGLSVTPEISLADEVTAGRPEAVRAWRRIEEWVLAAKVKRNLSGARFGFLGNTYSGMLDMYSDFTMIQGQTGAPGNHYEDIQGGFIVGHSLLTAKGIPCAGEGDLKACLAMKICDILGKGGSFCEIVVTDYEDGTILMGHDGPFHLEIARENRCALSRNRIFIWRSGLRMRLPIILP